MEGSGKIMIQIGKGRNTAAREKICGVERKKEEKKISSFLRGSMKYCGKMYISGRKMRDWAGN